MPCIDSLTPLTVSRLDAPNSFNIWNFAVLLGRVGDSTAMLQQMGVSRLIQELYENYNQSRQIHSSHTQARIRASYFAFVTTPS